MYHFSVINWVENFNIILSGVQEIKYILNPFDGALCRYLFYLFTYIFLILSFWFVIYMLYTKCPDLDL